MNYALAAHENITALGWYVVAGVLWATLLAWPFVRFYRRTEDGEG